jgi:apolipoprotein N-acyltransferase
MLERITGGRYYLAALGGFLLTLAFPKFDVAGLAWVAPGLILFSASGQKAAKCFRIGYIAGLVHFLTALYWILLIPFPGGAIAGWLALSAFCALYFGAWSWLSWKIFPGTTFVASAHTGTDSTNQTAQDFFGLNWLQRTVWAIACAMIWVAMEMLRARLLGGFPWIPVGASQHKILPVIQLASVTGVYGISFLTVWFAVSLSWAAFALAQKSAAYRSGMKEIILPLLVVLIVGGWGYDRLRRPATVRGQLKVALVQPSIKQEMIFDLRESPARFSKLMELSQHALAIRPDILIWPEASMPDFSEANFVAITNLIASNHVWMVFGADDVEVEPIGSSAATTNFFNGAFLFGPDGRYVERYHKRRLVMFGEFIPLANQLPFLRQLIPLGDFTPGDRVLQFTLSQPTVAMAPLICFEDVFPHDAREHLEDDTDFFLNLTNDGWFRQSAAHWQQLATAIFRAVENGVVLVRCTNNGITCWVDECGRVLQIFHDDAGNAYGVGFLSGEIPLPDHSKRRATIFRRHGDWFGWGCVFLTGATLAVSAFPRRKSRLATPLL